MHYKIPHRYSREILHEGEFNSMLACVHDAVQKRKDLHGADLSRANLHGADLSRADLYGANLSRADLSRADLSRADLYGANLSRANLHGANLSRADLSRADLSRANLHGANLHGADLSKFQIVPERGMFTAFKKVHADGFSYIAELIIPDDAKRINSPSSRKCRVSAARVIDIRTMDDKPTDIKEFFSEHNNTFVYRVGDLVEPRESFSDDIREVWASGIHCYITRQEAVEH